jgi:dihydrofolate reductase
VPSAPGGCLRGQKGVGGGTAESRQLVVDLPDGGRVEPCEERVGAPPGPVRGTGITGEPVARAEVREGAGLAVHVADRAEGVERLDVAGDGLGGLGGLAPAQPDVGEAGPGVRLVRAVAELLVEHERPRQEVEGPVVVADAAVVPAEVGERDGLPGPVAEPLEEVVGPAGGVERAALPALDDVHGAAPVVRPRLAGEVVAGQLQRGVEVAVGVVEAAQVRHHPAEFAPRAALLRRVAQPPGGGDGGALAGTVAEAGAMIGGRRTYDDSLRWWGADGPTGAARVPLFVVTHRAPAEVPENGVYTFVTDGLESTVRQAKETAAGKDVFLMGGPDVAGQFVRAGLVDQIGIHLVPVLFGGGSRLLEHLGGEHVQLRVVRVTDTPPATHLLYDIVT